MQQFRLDGKVALVTGASHGIGEGIALAYAEAGADVALAARSADDLERVAALVRERGRRALVVPTDVADFEQIPRMVDRTVRELGGLHVLANVAGVQRRKSILEVTLEDWNYVMDINLRGAYFVAREAGRVFCEQGAGKIVNIASMLSYRGFADISLYCLSKTAILGMTRVMAVEWAPHNVQVNAIAPGWIETPMTASMQPGRRKWVCDHVPQGCYGEPSDIASAAVYLCSDAARYVTGQTLPVDGGFLAGNPWPSLSGPA